MDFHPRAFLFKDQGKLPGSVSTAGCGTGEMKCSGHHGMLQAEHANIQIAEIQMAIAWRRVTALVSGKGSCITVFNGLADERWLGRISYPS